MKGRQMGLLGAFIFGLLIARLPQSSYYGFAIFLIAIFVGLFLVLGRVKRFDVWRFLVVSI